MNDLPCISLGYSQCTTRSLVRSTETMRKVYQTHNGVSAQAARNERLAAVSNKSANVDVANANSTRSVQDTLWLNDLSLAASG